MLQAWYSFLAQNPLAYAVDIATWLQAAFYWLMSQLDNQTQGQQNGWTGSYQAFSMWQSNHNRLLASIRYRLTWLYTYAYLGMGRWVSRKFIENEKWSAYWHDHLWRYITWVADRIYYMINSLTRWVENSVYKPLFAKVVLLGQQMKDWAYFSYELLSHPPKLADLTFWPLFGVFQQNPFTIGRTIGDWVAKLVYSQTVRSITLVEQIITDVL